ncbi:MAG: hypothetical protein K9G49_07700 [Taibaiella sp.]|nr:hypothetical protein [Taibaiella sp.]
MNLDERTEQNNSFSTFRTSLDVGMGVVYVVLGIVVFSMRYFGTLELPASSAYVLGSVMILYGVFRIYRGIVAIMRKRKNA